MSFVVLTKAAEKRIRLCEEHNLCRYCLQSLNDITRVVRKCHEKCDKINRRGVENGKWTDEEQQRKGMWGPPERTGRPMREPASIEDVSGEGN